MTAPYELFSHDAYLAGEHGNFARALARAAAAADGVNRDLLRCFWPQIVAALEHKRHTEAPWRVQHVRVLEVRVEHPQRKDGRWGAPGSCTGRFQAEPGARCSDCDATLFGAYRVLEEKPEPDPIPAEDAAQQEADQRREVEQDRAMCDGARP